MERFAGIFSDCIRLLISRLIFLQHHFFLSAGMRNILNLNLINLEDFRLPYHLPLKTDFLEKPVVDLWAQELAKAFLKKFPTLVFRRNEYNALLTIDTDQPFAYLGKNIFRSIGGLLHDKNSSPVTLADRYRIISKTEKDPFDVFDYIIENINKNNTDARFFFPVGDHSKFDKNPSWKNEEYRDLIHKIAANFKAGLHPSFTCRRR